MNFSLFYKSEQAPDYYDARKLLGNWVSSLLFSFSCISSKYQMMRTAGTECKLMGQHGDEEPCDNIVAFQNHVIQRIFNRIKLNSEGRKSVDILQKFVAIFIRI